MSMPLADGQMEAEEEVISQIQPIGYEKEVTSVNARVSSATGFCVIRTGNIKLLEHKLILRLNFFEPVFDTEVSLFEYIKC